MKHTVNKARTYINNQHGFSFIELMVVIVILGILATYVAPRLMGRTDEARAVKARLDINSLESALAMYYHDNQIYPSTEQGLAALVEKPTMDPVPTKWNEHGYLSKPVVPKDPWGRNYVYLSPGVNGDFDIICYGADGMAGGEGKNKDINSWEIE